MLALLALSPTCHFPGLDGQLGLALSKKVLEFTLAVSIFSRFAVIQRMLGILREVDCGRDIPPSSPSIDQPVLDLAPVPDVHRN
jgi:hypothetical protein